MIETDRKIDKLDGCVQWVDRKIDVIHGWMDAVDEQMQWIDR